MLAIRDVGFGVPIVSLMHARQVDAKLYRVADRLKWADLMLPYDDIYTLVWLCVVKESTTKFLVY